MNSLQRVFAATEFRPVDQVATIPLVMRYAARILNAPYSAYLQDPRLLAQAQLECQARYGYDYVTVCSDGYREAEACGAELSFPHDTTPKVERPAIEGPDDLRGKTVPDPEKIGRLKDRVESIRIFKDAVGGEVCILGWVEAPFAAAAAMCGLEPLLVNLHIDEGFVRDTLEFALAVETAFALAQIRAGADMIGVGDAAASLISPNHYRTLALPYEQRLLKVIRDAGAKAKLHICGNTTHLLDMMAESGADVVNVDWMVDLKAARRAFGTRTCLKGNMDPVAWMVQSTPDGIMAKSAEDISIAGRTGFILSPGCEVPPDAPEENLRAMVEAARRTRTQNGEPAL
jgi:MtaA/CmuA family methyltransferase